MIEFDPRSLRSTHRVALGRAVLVGAIAAAWACLAIATAQVDPQARALFDRALAAHGGESLEGMATYREEGTLITYDPSGTAVQETPYRTIIDFDAGTSRTEVVQDGAVTMVQQVTPDAGFAWSPEVGAMPLNEAQEEELRLSFALGTYGVRRGLHDVDSARALGRRTIAGVQGRGVEVTRDGRTVTFLFDDDGRLLADRYAAAQVGDVTNVYRAYETVEGVLLPVHIESHAMGGRFLATRVDSLEVDPTLADHSFATSSLGSPQPASRDVVDWLRDAAEPLDGLRAGLGFDDLAAFGAFVGDARLVALGEQTHGTSEFFGMKHRLLEYLVREKGFTLFAIEANMPEAERLNRYVLTGEGDPRERLAGLHFWTWNTREVLDMIAWMRGYNSTAPSPVQFVGFDMQFPDLAVQNVRDFLAATDADHLSRIAPILDEAEHGSSLTNPDGYPPESLARLHDELEGIVTDLEHRRDSYLDGADPTEVDWALQNARVVAQAVGRQAGGGPPSRDRAMARNVQWLLDQNPDAKMMIWAHNGHVATRDGWMGSHLNDAYGDDYLAIAFSFYEGEYRAMAPGADHPDAHAAGPALDGSIDALLDRIGPERLFLDLRGAERSPASSWLAQPRPFRSIGAAAVPDSAAYAPIVATDDFDALIFIRESTAAEPAP